MLSTQETREVAELGTAGTQGARRGGLESKKRLAPTHHASHIPY